MTLKNSCLKLRERIFYCACPSLACNFERSTSQRGTSHGRLFTPVHLIAPQDSITLEGQGSNEERLTMDTRDEESCLRIVIVEFGLQPG